MGGGAPNWEQVPQGSLPRGGGLGTWAVPSESGLGAGSKGPSRRGMAVSTSKGPAEGLLPSGLSPKPLCSFKHG